MYTDTDGAPLIFTDDIERLTGWKNETIRHYSAAAARARREGTVTEKHMPEAVKKVRRHLVKADGRPLVVWSPLYREHEVMAWLKARGVLDDSDHS